MVYGMESIELLGIESNAGSAFPKLNKERNLLSLS